MAFCLSFRLSRMDLAIYQVPICDSVSGYNEYETNTMKE